MFEGLKKKFSSLIESIAKKEEEQIKTEDLPTSEIPAETEKTETPASEKVQTQQVPQEPSQRHASTPSHSHEKIEPVKEHGEPAKITPKPEAPKPPVKKHEEQVKKEIPEKPAEPEVQMPLTPAKPEQTYEKKEVHRAPEKAPQAQHKSGIGFGTKLKGMIFKEVKVSEKDIDPFMEEFRMALLQSDVNYEVAEKLTDSIRKELLSNQISSHNIEKGITGAIRGSVLNVLNKGEGVNIVGNARHSIDSNTTPYKILFIGPNGAGKTTAIAKVASMLLNNNITCMISASDTFRAAAIEQTVHHAGKLGVPVVKGDYGADPASVAFDAIAYAKAHGISVVLIDSAGRQETNKSLMEEIKKMVRVNKPDIKIFVGESTAGNALLNQVKEFNEALKLDGIILTKLDCDAKGGNTISILSETSVPVLFFGTGEKYTDLLVYDPDFIVDSILPQAS